MDHTGSVLLFFIIVTLKVNDGDPEHAALQPSINREREKMLISGELIRLNNTHPIYCSVLLNFLARYLAEALLGILTMDSSLP